ncbi:amidohydrolase family protein [Paenibacillus sp. 481]|uniref:amidohydrolase family protein n=1 Tax=Paenibacillus sp. 481 TaxID=2835869 RepID=UPI001E51F6A1|nr:amidohydrolase family protein [Paenibacillus sp. 481]UHA75077.1 amidohydrolase family protein [Paenibacillus sp. 481]
MLIVIMLSGMLAQTSHAMIVPPKPTENTSLIVQDVTIVDVKTGKLKPNQSVVVTDNQIARIDDTSDIDVPDKARIIKASGKYLIPGLWDMHVHMDNYMDSAVPHFLANGVTGVRDMGSSLHHVQITHKLNQKGTLTPRIVYSGKVVNKFPNNQVPPHQYNLQTEAEARKAVRQLKSYKVDHVKIYSHISENMYKAVVDEANKQQLPISGHLPFTVGAGVASNDGMRSFEHLHGMHIATASKQSGLFNRFVKQAEQGALDKDHLLYYEYELQAAAQYDAVEAGKLFEIFKKNETYQVPTLVTMTSLNTLAPDERIRFIQPAIQQQWAQIIKQSLKDKKAGVLLKKMEQINLDLVRKMNQAGVPIMAGSDVTYGMQNLYYGFSLHEELQLLVKAGLSPLQALQSATINPARYLENEDQQGTVEAGKQADLVLLDANPLTDIRNTTRIHAVVMNGHLLDKTALTNMVKTYPVIEEFSRSRKKK